MLLIGAEVDFDAEAITDVDRCVDLAANQALPLNAHHEHVHFGQGNVALLFNEHRAIKHVALPTAPFPEVPWTDCASLLDFFGLD